MNKRIPLIFFCILVLLKSSPLFSQENSIKRPLEDARQKESQGNYEAAQSFYEGILTHHPEHKEALLGLGRVQYWQGNYKGAVATYEKMLKIYPEDAGALVGIGKAHLALGDPKKAQVYFDRAQKIDPQNQEIEALVPELEPKAFLEFEGGFRFEDFDTLSTSQLEYQEIRYQKENAFGLGVHSGYLNKFGKGVFNTGFFGNYHFAFGTKIAPFFFFAPRADAVPRLNSGMDVRQKIWKGIRLGSRYEWQKFSESQFHLLGPYLEWQVFSWVTFQGNWEMNFARTPSKEILHSYGANVELVPAGPLMLSAGYKRLDKNFEGGRTPPFIRYKAHLLNTSLKAVFESFLVRFGFEWEDRNNGESVYRYLLGLGYRF